MQWMEFALQSQTTRLLLTLALFSSNAMQPYACYVSVYLYM